MVNKAILVGRLGRDPEVRRTNTGMAVVNFSVATDEPGRKGDSSGEGRESRTEWHNIVAFGRLAEICGEYLRKGKLVYIEGRLQTRDWEDRDGNKRRTTEIIANEMKMLSGGPGDATSDRGSDYSTQGQQAAGPMEKGITDDDIPF